MRLSSARASVVASSLSWQTPLTESNKTATFSLERTVHQGNRTEILLLRDDSLPREKSDPSATSLADAELAKVQLTSTQSFTHEKLIIQKRLRNFANVGPERVALTREACLQSLAQGPGVVPILSSSVTSLSEIGAPTEEDSFVRHFVPGLTLEDLLRGEPHPRVRAGSQHDACRVVSDLASTLERVHSLEDETVGELQLIHRDISPSNVLLERDDSTGEAPEDFVWLNDFGLAHARSLGPVADDEIGQGVARLLPPEVQRGGQPLQAGDVYQLGLLLGLMILGRPAGKSSTESALGAKELRAVCQRQLEVLKLSNVLDEDPAKRPSAGELAIQLRERER